MCIGHLPNTGLLLTFAIAIAIHFNFIQFIVPADISGLLPACLPSG